LLARHTVVDTDHEGAMTRAARFAGCGLVLAAVALAGCRKNDEETGASNLGPVHVDTSNNTPLDGMSDAQLKQQAQALTPEQAAAAGVAVDTTIHVENLGDQDTTPAATASDATSSSAGASAAAAPSAAPAAGAPAAASPNSAPAAKP
jgi:hypothetical protein